MKINGRAKGGGGEREFCKWLQENLELSFLPTRNLEQTRDGGADICDMPPFMFEVKRCEGLSLRDWWLQVSLATTSYHEKRIRVVAFRRNKQKWAFLISATWIGLEKGFVQLEEFEGKTWLKSKLLTSLKQNC